MGANGWLLANIGWVAPVLAAVAVAALALAAWLAFRLTRLERHYSSLTAGTDGGDLRAVLDAHVREVRAAVDCAQEADALVRDVQRAGRRHMQRVGFLRFNPFRDAGGDQSFALALTDGEGNGFVLSSLHGRDGTRIYGKPLVGWNSTYPLTDEEKQAIDKAKQ